jgi:hypothetical protein
MDALLWITYGLLGALVAYWHRNDPGQRRDGVLGFLGLATAWPFVFSGHLYEQIMKLRRWHKRRPPAWWDWMLEWVYWPDSVLIPITMVCVLLPMVALMALYFRWTT